MIQVKSFVAVLFIALLIALPVRADERGECLQKSSVDQSEAYKACNEKYGASTTNRAEAPPERTDCFKKADQDKRDAQKICFDMGK